MAISKATLSILSATDADLLKKWLLEFDQSWKENRLAERVRELPPVGNPLRRAALVELIKMDLKRQWQQGRQRSVEAYLRDYPELGTAETVPIELLFAEYKARRHAGIADLTEFVARFPRKGAELRQLIGQAETIDQSHRAKSDTAVPGALASTLAQGKQPAVHGELPEQFGRYRILKRLGSGGMGTVYLAQDTQLDRPVALKVPHFTAKDGPDVLERFHREARAAATINHPNICPVYDVGLVDGKHYVTMAYLEGKPLSDLIENTRPLPQRPVAAVLRKLALALQEAHSHGVIHRDLKPSNIMINKRNEPVVMDFGLARQMDKNERLTQSGMIMGTPAYMSPEQVQGDVKAMGPGSDIYSLGVILYELLTGKLPFDGPVTAILAKILTETPIPPSRHRADLEPALETVCLRAMAKRIPDRYASMAELATALSEFLKSSGTPAKKRAGANKAPVPVAAIAPEAKTQAPPETEGMATQLIKELAARMEAGPAASQAAGARNPRWWQPLLAAMIVLGFFAVIAVLVARRGDTTVKVDTSVLVQLQGLQQLSDPAVILVVLDGKEVKSEDLARPLTLRTGEHELEIKRKDGKVEKHTFSIGKNDTAVNPFEQKLVRSDPAGQKASESDPPVAKGQIPGQVIWDLKQLREYFTILNTSYDANNHRVIWLIEALRDFNNIYDLSWKVRYYDAEGARLADSELSFAHRYGVLEGERQRVRLGFDADLAKRARKMIRLDQNQSRFPEQEKAQVAKDGGKLPNQVDWDLAPLREHFAILKTDYDPLSNQIVWLVEAKRAFSNVYDLPWKVRLYDADGAVLKESELGFEFRYSVLEGERLRVRLPFESDLSKRVHKMTLGK